MKCPRAVAEVWETGHKPQFVYGDCLQEECAWWDRTYERCDPAGLTHNFERLTNELIAIRNKMPHEAQFRK